MIELPTPSIAPVTDYASFTSANYVPPVGYIRRAVPRDTDLVDAPKIVEYDLEYEDEVREGGGMHRVGAGGGHVCARSACTHPTPPRPFFAAMAGEQRQVWRRVRGPRGAAVARHL